MGIERDACAIDYYTYNKQDLVLCWRENKQLHKK